MIDFHQSKIIIPDFYILSIHHLWITFKSSLAKQIQKYQPGDEVELKILHDGEEKTVTAILEEYKQ
ncbi:PDZ domain-containing protein [Patescibacteria group bacterium AH-259-L07]|nr:PDZ domain-containing protein [Patescibacteria group bacterium AH-259-L07]